MKLFLIFAFAFALVPHIEALAEFRVETVMVSMRDGVKLATDVYRDDSVKQAPVVLMRTPYDRTKQKGLGERWVKAGYIFVSQDCRGTKASEGVMAPYNNEGQDGFDTIEWITRQTWCSGRVGDDGWFLCRRSAVASCSGEPAGFSCNCTTSDME